MQVGVVGSGDFVSVGHVSSLSETVAPEMVTLKAKGMATVFVRQSWALPVTPKTTAVASLVYRGHIHGLLEGLGAVGELVFVQSVVARSDEVGWWVRRLRRTFIQLRRVGCRGRK